ncbi:MAG: hypothetical protein LUG19_00875, partial [Desulfovibrio sp.]|nr:hypothetical protein [Desulfovibrio sp.]
MPLSFNKNNAPASTENEGRSRQTEARPGGDMPAMPGAAHAPDDATPFAAMLDERAARATDLAAWKGEKSPAAGPPPQAGGGPARGGGGGGAGGGGGGGRSRK